MADLSLKDFPMPNLTEFINVELPKTSEQRTNVYPRLSDVVLPRNQWYYKYEKKAGSSDAGGGGGVGEGAMGSKPMGEDVKVSTNDVISWMTFVSILSAIDLVWFMHRMARTYSTAKLILYGSQHKCKEYLLLIRKLTDSETIVMFLFKIC